MHHIKTDLKVAETTILLLIRPEGIRLHMEVNPTQEQTDCAPRQAVSNSHVDSGVKTPQREQLMRFLFVRATFPLPQVRPPWLPGVSKHLSDRGSQ